MSDLMTRIQNNLGEFSKGQRLIAHYIAEHYDKAAFMTANKLGTTVGVSESTVVRFATELGYDGYPHLQKTLQEMIRNRLTSVQRMEVTNDRLGNRNVLQTVLSTDMEKIRMTLEEINQDAFDHTIEALTGARRIYILGVRSSSALANFMSFYMSLIFDNVHLVQSNTSSEIFEQILRIGEGDVLFGVSFPRYSKRTLSAMKYSHDQGATVIALTDSHLSPLTQYADQVLIAKSDMASFVDSLVAPLSVINALIVALGLERQTEIEDAFCKLETIWEEYEVYEKLEGEI